ncbi:MAG: DUF4012 domain-containing protein [Patescibacteria group bacterium]
MVNTAHIISGKQKILVVDSKQSVLTSRLKQYLKKYDNDVYFSPNLPPGLTIFDFCFLINDDTFIRRRNELGRWQSVILIYTKNSKKAWNTAKTIEKEKIPHVKIIHCLDAHSYTESMIEEIIWFSLSKSKEIYLSVRTHVSSDRHLHTVPQIKNNMSFTYKIFGYIEKLISKKNITLVALFAIFVYHTAFLLPLVPAGLSAHKAIKEMEDGKYKVAAQHIKDGEQYVTSAKQLYNLARPTFLLFSLAQIPDDIFSIHERIIKVINISQILQEDTHQLFSFVFKKNKTADEKKQTSDIIILVQKNVSKLEEHLIYLNQKIPTSLSITKPYKESLTSAIHLLGKTKKIVPFFSELIAYKNEKKYLLLFANNMELRPGGGFIGSYGVVSMKDLTFEDLSIYDVYDADGQLTAHIPPPPAIRDYLSQPHWFLRDSAFSPDFYENYYQAKYFLAKEKQFSEFDGGILITTSAIKNILKAYGDLYLPDFNEKVNSDNFYIKTQLYAEKEFFPGSTQKKSFLSAVTRQILINMDTVSQREILLQIIKSAEEKQIAFYLEEENLQKIIDSFYWSGRIIEPFCPSQVENCYTDFLFPYDANLGVNKANFFVNRKMDVKIHIDEEGFVHTYLNIHFRNESLQDIFPGGVYRNYLQILVPRNSLIKQITVADKPVTNYDQEIGQFKRVGFFFEIPIQSQKNITIEYKSLKAFDRGRSIYQLLFQKQTGSINNDLNLEITLPSNMFLVNQNFSPLVKHNQIIYNTNLSTDKIFFIELLKD